MARATLVSLLLLATITAAQSSPARGAQSCERVAQLKIANTTIEARLVAAGTFRQPGNTAPPPALAERYKTTPEFCRVTAHAHPSSDSDIVIEVWLPVADWNGKLQGLGTGGFAGVIPYPTLATVVKRGYAAAVTDTGHTQGEHADWALGHPEKIVDYGYRGVHEMTSVAKAAIAAFYGSKEQHSYFLGCSNGGRQALMEAQRFPDDYDGILAGAPANDWTHLMAGALWSMKVTGDDPESYFPSAKWKAVEAAVNEKCDAGDGVKDGILNDPRQCRFDPASMQCKDGVNGDTCLTPKQVVTLRKIYEGPHDARGRRIFFGLLPGAESRQSGWESWVSGAELGKSADFFFGKEFFTNFIYQDNAWDYRKADFGASAKEAERMAPTLSSTDPNLSRLAKRGGKLILYHGWNDPAIPATSTVNYFENVQKKMGTGQTEKFVRLYMVPGMQHCGGGPGATNIGGNTAPFEPDRNLFSALEAWVEKGVAPGTITASRQNPAMTRPLCPYPQSAKYKGSSDVNSADSFTCAK